MQQKTIILTNKLGLHARPAAVLVQKANQFQSDIVLKTKDKEANAKSILGILALGVRQGTAVTISVNGPDELKCMAELSTFLTTGSGED